MTSTAPMRRRRRRMDLDAILDAALALVDDTGRLTMTELAAALAVSPSSLYHHVGGRAELLGLVRGRLVAHFADPSVLHGDWSDQVRFWARAIRDAISAHPRLVPLLVAQNVTAAAELHSYNHIVRELQHAGFPSGELMLWVSVLDALAIGSALDLSAPEDVWNADSPDSPTLTAALARAPRGHARVDAAFDLGLTALIDGMKMHLARITN